MAILQEGDLVFGGEDRGVGICLGNLLFRLQKLKVALFEFVMLLAGIEFYNEIALFDGLPGARKTGDLKGVSADGGGDDYRDVAGAQLTRRAWLQVLIASFELRHVTRVGSR